MALTGSGVVIQIITTIVFILINALLLMVATKIFKVKDTSYKTALGITAILGVINFVIGLLVGLIPSIAGIISTLLVWVVVGILLAMYLIKIKYGLDWGKAALVWLVYFVLAIVAYMILAIILGLIFAAVGLGAIAAAV